MLGVGQQAAARPGDDECHCLTSFIIGKIERESLFTSINQGLSKHQEVGFTPVTKVPKFIVVFWDLLGAIQK